jgi:hypothetical protein
MFVPAMRIDDISYPCAPQSCSLRSYLVDFEILELVTTMRALAQFVHHARAFSDSAEPGGTSADQQTRDSAKRYVETAETLIMRLQDSLDEDQLDVLRGRACVAPTQSIIELRSVRAKADIIY